MPPLDSGLAARLHGRANAARWGVPVERFAAALEASLARAVEGGAAAPGDAAKYVAGLHLEDLALACACADGHEGAWEHFVREHRPVLYRAADALAPGGAAREIADGIYADLFGIEERGGERRSLFRYFHGRSSLATWLRAVLSQRWVDRIRQQRRVEPLLDADAAPVPASRGAANPDRDRYVELIRSGLARAVEELPPRDRLRLGLYYAQQLKLIEIGRILQEHEATVSRQLARTRGRLRELIDARLRAAGLTPDEIGQCYESLIEDAGPLDLAALLASDEPRKTDARQRSNSRGRSRTAP